MTRTQMTTFMLAWHCTMRTTLSTSTDIHMSIVRILWVSLVFTSSAHTHAPWLKFDSFMSSPWPCTCVRSLHLDPPFLHLALPFASYPLPQVPEVCGKPAQLRQREYGRHRRVLPLHRLELLFSCDATLSGFEDLHLSSSDQFTMWEKWHLMRFWPCTWWTFTELRQISVTLVREFRLHLLKHPTSTNSSLLNHLCKRGSAFTTGTLGPDEVEKVLSRNKLQESGTLFSCKKLLNMSHMTSFMNDFVWPTLRVVRLSSTRTHFILTSASNPSTLTIRDEGEQGWFSQDVLSRASFRRAAVSGQKVFNVLSLYISNIYVKIRAIAKKIIQATRALMISQNIDSVIGDFIGAAWCCRSRDNISTIDEVFSDITLRTSLTPHSVVGTWIHSEQLAWRLWFS